MLRVVSCNIQYQVVILFCLYRASCTDYYRDEQMRYVHINDILCIVSTATCFDASESSSGSRIHVLC